MAFYSDVRRGENFKPSALMFNDIARSLNKIDGFRSYGISKVDDGATRISVCNETTVTLVARSAIQLHPAKSGLNISRPDLSPPYGVSVYDSTSAWNWCILEETLNPGEIGSAILFGVTEVVLSIPNSDTDKIPANGFVVPNSDDPDVFDIVSYPTQAKLLRVHKGENGNFVAEIAFIPFKTGGASDEYNGYFKVSISGDEVLIFDGSRPNSEYAGYTDLPGAQTVRRETLQFSMDSGDKTLYLLACHNKDNGYSIKFSFSERDDDCFYDTILARVSHNSGVTQIYKINDTIRFSKDFYL